jgi:hypothetical protein
VRGTLHFIFIDVADRQTMDQELAGVIAELLPKPRKEGLRAQPAEVEIVGMTTSSTLGSTMQVCVLVRITVP